MILKSTLGIDSTSEDWEYFYIPDAVKTHFIPVEDGNAELVVLVGLSVIFSRMLRAERSHWGQVSEHNRCTLFNTMVDGIAGYATQDILSPHPTKKGWWKVFGRADDQIMHSTGEKVRAFFSRGLSLSPYASYIRLIRVRWVSSESFCARYGDQASDCGL